MAARGYFVRLLGAGGVEVFRSAIWATSRTEAERRVRKLAADKGIPGVVAAIVALGQ